MYEPSSTLWESWTGDTMTQWLDESSRNHHYQTSINTFLRKYVIGLDQESNSSSWSHIRARPEAALVHLYDREFFSKLPCASTRVASHRGVISLSWSHRVNTNNNKTDGTSVFAMNISVPPGSKSSIYIPLIRGGN